MFKFIRKILMLKNSDQFRNIYNIPSFKNLNSIDGGNYLLFHSDKKILDEIARTEIVEIGFPEIVLHFNKDREHALCLYWPEYCQKIDNYLKLKYQDYNNVQYRGWKAVADTFRGKFANNKFPHQLDDILPQLIESLKISNNLLIKFGNTIEYDINDTIIKQSSLNFNHIEKDQTQTPYVLLKFETENKIAFAYLYNNKGVLFISSSTNINDICNFFNINLNKDSQWIVGDTTSLIEIFRFVHIHNFIDVNDSTINNKIINRIEFKDFKWLI